MKRCPQCEFVYEDDQSLCDMDGILLVFDPQQLPKPLNSGSKSKRPQWRARVVPALAALVLATVLYLVYFVSTNQQPVRQTYSPAAPTASAATNSVAPATDKQASPEGTAAPEETKVSTPAPEVKENKEQKAKANTAPAAKAVKESKEKPKTKPKAQSSTTANEDESKIGSLLKKTGRILKKPFKF